MKPLWASFHYCMWFCFLLTPLTCITYNVSILCLLHYLDSFDTSDIQSITALIYFEPLSTPLTYIAFDCVAILVRMTLSAKIELNQLHILSSRNPNCSNIILLFFHQFWKIQSHWRYQLILTGVRYKRNIEMAFHKF